VHWWLILLEGIAAFVVGILILAAPGISVLALTQLLGAYWLVSGVFSLVSIFTNRSSWGWKLVTGILGVVSGLIVFQYPLWSAVFVPTVLGIFLGIDGILIGVMRLIMYYRGAGWGVAPFGILTGLLGFVLLLFPPLPLLTAVYMFAFLAIAGGVAAFFMALRLGSTGEIRPGRVSSSTVPIPVTGAEPVESEPETEHEGEETGEYTGEEDEFKGEVGDEFAGEEGD